ncbi:MAG TPA: IPT/TIG domain-containing protein [Conexibacter sp.]|nr:IPT/TIG domain-containing protein [Conexibacter sp.]
MFRRQFVTAVLATGCLLVPSVGAGASLPTLHAAAVDQKVPAVTTPLPVIKSVKPLRLTIGETLTIVGRNFLPGRGRNTVVFFHDGAPAIFLRAGTATKTRMTVKLTTKLGRFLTVRNNGDRAPTRFRLRVLARRFGARFTPPKLSPLVLPSPPRRTAGAPPAAPTCTLASAAAAPTADTDGDALTNALEIRVKTDPCIADSDGDSIPDGYEYEAALDYNSRALPYPGKRPYPNPLDPSDAKTDYDSDGLSMADEHAAWVLYGHSTFPLNYSDGTQTSGGPVAVPPGTEWADLNRDGFLTDDEKDLDGDGLTNWDEAHGRMTPPWWQAAYPGEAPYTLTYQQTDWLDPDTDGDTLPDGPDDVDHDGFANADEVTRFRTWVQPFNPCLPDPTSPVCAKHPPFDSVYPPFATPGWIIGEPIPLRWPR